MRCGRCRRPGHSWKRCPQNPESTVSVDVPQDAAEILLRDRLRPLLRAAAWSTNLIDTLMLSCYLQGALDGRRPEVADTVKMIEERCGK